MKNLGAFFLVICVFSFSWINADISKYLKKANNKDESIIHKIRNVDFIYMINLDQRPERFERSLEELHPYGIFPYRFSAVNGYAFSLEEINELGVKLAPGMKTGELGIVYYEDPITGLPMPTHEVMNEYGKTYFNVNHGGLGCVLSHLSVLQDAYDSNYETIWILEDDIQVKRDPRVMPDLIDEMDRIVGKGNWDILFTDKDVLQRNGNYLVCGCAPSPCRPDYTPPKNRNFSIIRQVSPNLRQIGSRFGTHSMIVRRSGMQKILNFIKPRGVFLNIDQDVFLTEGIRLYTVTQDVVANWLEARSDAQNAWDLFQQN